jgi:hypothetical protein
LKQSSVGDAGEHQHGEERRALSEGVTNFARAADILYDTEPP